MTYVINVENNSTHTLAGPTTKDPNAQYAASITALVQLDSTGAVSFIPYKQGDDATNAQAAWAKVAAIASAAPAGSTSSATGTSSGSKTSGNATGSGSGVAAGTRQTGAANPTSTDGSTNGAMTNGASLGALAGALLALVAALQ